MVWKKEASEKNPIKLFLMWYECRDRIIPILQKSQNFIQFIDKVSIKLPKKEMDDIFPPEMDECFSDDIIKLLNEQKNSEDDFVNIPLKICTKSLVCMWLLTKAKFRSWRKLKNYAITNTYNICSYNLSSNDVDVTLLDVAMFCRIVLNEEMFLFIDKKNNVALMDASSIVYYWILKWSLEWRVINIFGFVDILVEDYGWEWRKIISELKYPKEKILQNWKYDNKLFEDIDKAMSKVSKGTIVIEYKNYKAEYLTHNFKSEDLSKYKELQDYATNEWNWCWSIWKETFKWRTVAITWSKKIKLKEDKKRKK